MEHNYGYFYYRHLQRYFYIHQEIISKKLKMEIYLEINTFQTNLRFSDVFREYRKGTLALNGLIALEMFLLMILKLEIFLIFCMLFGLFIFFLFCFVLFFICFLFLFFLKIRTFVLVTFSLLYQA